MRRRRRQRKRTPKAAAKPKKIAPKTTTRRAQIWRSLLAIGGAALVLCAGVVDAAPAKRIPLAAAARLAPNVAAPFVAEAPAPVAQAAAWGEALPTVSVTNTNTSAHGDLRLYTDGGALDMNAVYAFMRVACTVPDEPDRDNGEVAEPLETRLVQLAFRASYHFAGAPMQIVSAVRRGAQGKHGHGEALDFKLDGVPASDLASYVRAYPRAGIGIYTHPKTQYVHIDVREHSYHWIDGSPPGVTWREQLLPDPSQEDRDAAYAPLQDLPEAAL